MRNAIRSTSGRRKGQRFDADHGVVTEALIFLGELDPQQIGPALEDATHYEPTPLPDFDAVAAALPDSLERFAFVDVGAGMGRVVLLASRHPFRQIVGIEVSPALYEIGRENLQRWRRSQKALGCNDLRMINADASRWTFPPGDVVFYLYNPFGGATLQRFIERAARETAGECWLVYHTPVHREIVEDGGAFERVSDLRFGVIYRKR